MASRHLFGSSRGQLGLPADTTNEAGGKAYSFTDEHALAQYAATGCLSDVFYANAKKQLDAILTLCESVEPRFIAQTAIYARQSAYMKDTPALLLAILTQKDLALFQKVFDRVIDDGKMLKNFVQIMRSGVVGRKSLGSCPKRMVKNWLEARTDNQLIYDSVGKNPSLPDVIKMVHPKPGNKVREALYAWFVDRKYDPKLLPEVVQQFEGFKKGYEKDVPNVPFQMLSAQSLSVVQWKQIAINASWQTVRQNLNTFQRHGVFEDREMVLLLANRLRDPELVKRARVFPYQLLMAFKAVEGNVPREITEALQDAMEVATQNIPSYDCRVVVVPDISKSMKDPITGIRVKEDGTEETVYTKARIVDAAALIAASILRTNRLARVIPFNETAISLELNPRDSVMTNAQKMYSIARGGTNCSAPLSLLNAQNEQADLIIYVSDNQSWLDKDQHPSRRMETPTTLTEQWNLFKVRNPKAKLICLDIQPYDTTQIVDRVDTLNIGGFSDNVFDIINQFVRGELHAQHWVDVIKQIEI